MKEDVFMLFNEFGDINAPCLLLLHGMMQDWRSEYKILGPLEKHYRLIIPAQDGFYDGSSDFTCFADQARQIEEYIIQNHIGKVQGAYGASQGGLMLTELLSRNKIDLGTVIMDGYGHGEFLMKHSDECCKKIHDTISKKI